MDKGDGFKAKTSLPKRKKPSWKGLAATILGIGLVAGALGGLAPIVQDAIVKWQTAYHQIFPIHSGTNTIAVSANAIITTNNVTATVDAYGVWDWLGGADKNMDTNFKDVVRPKCTTELKVVDNEVYASINFYVKESGGDGTSFGGTKDFHVYTPPVGYEIKSLNAKGKNPVSFTGETHGQNHGRDNKFDTAPTYWNKLTFCVDSSANDDTPAVGVGGSLSFSVNLAPRQ